MTEKPRPDLINRIKYAMRCLDGEPCECDPDAGAVPCETCGELWLLRDCLNEIKALRKEKP